MHVPNLVKIHLLILKIFNRNAILTLNNSKLDVINVNAYAKFGQNAFIYSQDVEWKWNSDVTEEP